MPKWTPTSPAILPKDIYGELEIHADSVLVVHWWAVWNNYDRQMDDRIQALRPTFAGQIVFRSFDVDHPDGFAISHECGVLNLPALVCFIRGKHFATLIGLGALERTEAALTSWSLASG